MELALNLSYNKREWTKKGVFRRRVRRFARFLTAPPETLTAPDLRRQSRLLSALLIIIIAAGILMSVSDFFPPHDPWGVSLPDTLVALVSLFLLVSAYGLNRFGRYRASAALSISVMTVTIFIMAYPTSTPDDVGMLYFIVIPILFSNILLPFTFNVCYSLTVVAGMIVFRLMLPQLKTEDVPIVTTAVLAGLSLFAAGHYKRLENDRRTVLEKSEARFRTLLNNAPDAVLLIELPEGRIIEANERAVSLLGKNREQLISSSLLGVLCPSSETAAADNPGIIDALHSAEEGWTSEIESRFIGRHGLPVLCRMHFVRNSLGRRSVDQAQYDRYHRTET